MAEGVFEAAAVADVVVSSDAAAGTWTANNVARTHFTASSTPTVWLRIVLLAAAGWRWRIKVVRCDGRIRWLGRESWGRVDHGQVLDGLVEADKL
jgi:hypothetical protein